jgi:hypothetical protein
MVYEYIIPKTRYYTNMTPSAPYQTWESDRITLKRPSGAANGDRVSLPFVNSFIQFKINKPIPTTSILAVYGGLIASYNAIQALVTTNNFSAPTLLGTEGIIIPPPALAISSDKQTEPLPPSGPPPPDFGGVFNSVILKQNQTFSNLGQNAFYRLSFALDPLGSADPFPLDVTIWGAIVASD